MASLFELPTIDINRNRYDELIRKEEQLNILLRVLKGDIVVTPETLNLISNMEDDGK